MQLCGRDGTKDFRNTGGDNMLKTSAKKMQAFKGLTDYSGH